MSDRDGDDFNQGPPSKAEVKQPDPGTSLFRKVALSPPPAPSADGAPTYMYPPGMGGYPWRRK